MGATPMQLHKDAVTSAEVTRQNAMAVPGLTAAAAKAADIAYHQAAVTSAMANSVSAGGIVDGAARAWRGCPGASERDAASCG